MLFFCLFLPYHNVTIWEMRQISYSRISILFIFRVGRSWEDTVLGNSNFLYSHIFLLSNESLSSNFTGKLRNIFFKSVLSGRLLWEHPVEMLKTYFSYLFRSPCPFQGCHSIRNALGPSILQQFSPIFHPSTNPPFLYPPIISIRMSNRNKQEMLLIVGSDCLQTNSNLKIKLMKIIKWFFSPYKSIET